jgi:hypothetical protein
MVLKMLLDTGIKIKSITNQNDSLEDVFELTLQANIK